MRMNTNFSTQWKAVGVAHWAPTQDTAHKCVCAIIIHEQKGESASYESQKEIIETMNEWICVFNYFN